MILTGKAKEDFEKSICEILRKNYDAEIESEDRAIKWIVEANELILNSHIIEWFDSVGIYIDIEFFRKDLKDQAKFVTGITDYIKGYQNMGNEYNSRQEATKQAIIKANQIYNNLNK